MTKTVLILFFLSNLLVFNGLAQLGGIGSFESISLASNANLIALGGTNLTQESDINFLNANPALLNKNMVNETLFDINIYYGDVIQNNITYIFKIKKLGPLAFTIKSISYGTLTGYDLQGNYISDFKAFDYALILNYAYEIKPFSLGIGLKWAGASIDQYSGQAVFLDIATTFFHPKKDFRIALAIKNLGFIIKNLSENEIFNSPLDLQIGTTFKPEKFPFTFSLTFHNLLVSNIVYNDIQQNNLLGIDNQSVSFLNRFSRYMILSSELELISNFHIYFGYNFLMKQELGSGIGLGIKLKVKKINISYAYYLARANYANHALSFAFKPKNFIRKKKVIN